MNWSLDWSSVLGVRSAVMWSRRGMVAGGVVDGGLDRSVVVSWFDGSVGGLVGSNVVDGSFGSSVFGGVRH